MQTEIANAQPDPTNMCYYARGMVDAFNIIFRSMPPEARTQQLLDALGNATTKYNQMCGDLNISAATTTGLTLEKVAVDQNRDILKSWN